MFSMQRIAAFLLGATLALNLLSTQATAAGRGAEQIAGEYLVKYKDNPVVSLASVRSVGSVRIMDHNPIGQLFKVKVNPADEFGAVSRLWSDPNVEYVVPNVRLHAFRAPVTMQGLKDQWAMKKVNAEAAWKRAGNKGSRKVVVAVIDTGVDYNHPNLKPNMVPGYDFHDNTSDPYDKTSAQNPGHGTHCAGIIGATGLVDGGTIGMSPEVSMMPLRFLGEDGSGDLNAGIKAIDYAIQKKADVISASWGATINRSQAQPLVDAVKRADDAGVIFVVAAANDSSNNDTTEVYPANSGFPNTISVAASGPQDEKPSWSNYGKRTVHLAAPGLQIMSTLPQNKYANLSGTSMATPLVSGMVAFLKAQDPTLTGAEVRALLQTTGAKVNIETACNCRVDAMASVDALLSKKMWVTPAAGTVNTGASLQFAGTHGVGPFTFELSNPSTGTITQDGLFTAQQAGVTQVTVRDANGQTATSLDITVTGATQPPPDGGGGETQKCPYEDASWCDTLCKIDPTYPFCPK